MDTHLTPIHEITIAKIFSPTDAVLKKLEQLEIRPLKIDNKDIHFLKPTLTERIKFQEIETSSPFNRLWLLKFFADTPFEVPLVVALRTLNEKFLIQRPDIFNPHTTEEMLLGLMDAFLHETLSEHPEERHTSRHILLRLARNSPDQHADMPSQIASRWLRGSGSLKHEAFDLHNDKEMVVDGSGMGVICQQLFRPSRFERMLILYALAQAYRSAIDNITTTIAASCDKPAILHRLYRDILSFNVRCFFRYPVRMDRIELPEVWDRIHERFQLTDLNTELTDQVGALRQILNEEENQLASERANRLNIRLAVLSFFITLLSLLTLLEITPETIEAFVHGWRVFFSG